MFWLTLALSMGGGLALLASLSLWLIRWLGRSAPYDSFIRLRWRRKLTFLRLLLSDPRVPLYAKVLTLAALIYMVSPVDLIPGVPLDDIAVALLALVLIIRLTPRQVVLDLVQQAESAG